MIATSRRARLLLRRVPGQHGGGSGNEIAVAVGHAPVGQAARTARMVAAQGSGATVCLPSSSNGCTCTDCAPAFTAANASAAIWGACEEQPGVLGHRSGLLAGNGLEDRACVIQLRPHADVVAWLRRSCCRRGDEPVKKSRSTLPGCPTRRRDRNFARPGCSCWLIGLLDVLSPASVGLSGVVARRTS